MVSSGETAYKRPGRIVLSLGIKVHSTYAMRL